MILRAIRVSLALVALCLLVGYASNPTRLGMRDAEAAAVVPLDTALRTLDSVEDFSDYLDVARNRYAEDVTEAFELGLVVGKYDERSNYYDPNTLVTTGEMANILARNLGAHSSVQGQAALSYLGNLGVTVESALETALSLVELQSMAAQIQRLDIQAKADLLVIRQAAMATLPLDTAGGITRAHAVAMYHPSQNPGGGWGDGNEPAKPGQPTSQPEPQPQVPASQEGGGKSSGKKTGKKGSTEEAREGTPVEPLFVLTG